MRWDLDTEAGSLYVRFAERPVDRQDELPEGVIVDLDADGSAVGVEILSAWSTVNWPSLARLFQLDENEAASLEFLMLALLSTVMAPDREASLRADVATRSTEPARVIGTAAA